MIIYQDHLETALALAVEKLREREAGMGFTSPSCMLSVLQDALRTLRRGGHVEVSSRRDTTVF